MARLWGGGNPKWNNFSSLRIAGKNAEHKDGVGMILSRADTNSLLDWKPISERIITACFRTLIRNKIIGKCCTPIETTEVNRNINFASN
jgi:hypothetical protein